MDFYRVIVKCKDAEVVIWKDGANAFQYETALQIKKDMEMVVEELNTIKGVNESIVDMVKICVNEVV